MLKGVGADRDIAAIMGTFVVTKAEVRANHGTNSPVSGCIELRQTCFL